MKAILTLLIIFGLSSSALAGDKGMKHDHSKMKDHDHSKQTATYKKQGKDKLVIKVKGMVCDFCAQGVKKNFDKRPEVKGVKVNLDDMTVTVVLKPGKQLSESTLKDLIESAGFSFVGIKS